MAAEKVTPAFLDPRVVALIEKIRVALEPVTIEIDEQQLGVPFLVALHCLASAMAAQATATLEDTRALDELCRNSARGAWLSTVAARFPDSTEALAGRIFSMGQAMEEDGLKPQWPQGGSE